MNHQRILGTFALAALVAASACSGNGGALPGGTLPSGGSLSPASQEEAALETPEHGYYPMVHAGAARRVCGDVPAGHERCFAWRRTDLVPQAAGDDAIPAGVGYTPADIAKAYDLDQARGGGQIVATVDAYGYTEAESDLAFYRKAAGLPACTTASGCLQIVNESGATSPLPQPNSNPNDDWRPEQTLDLDAISASCPKCKIVLVQTNSDSVQDLAIGAQTAGQRMHASVISNSYGGNESDTAPLAADYNQPGHVIVASAGDNGGGLADGGGPAAPCTLPTVVCAGGTQLTRTSGSGRGWSERVWNTLGSNACGGNCGATGSGCSVVFAKPAWQSDTGCHMRSAVDISADASVNTPLAIYSVLFKTSPPYSPWTAYGGTSLSSPLIAGMFALAGNASTRHGAQEIWQHHTAFYDVTLGTNVLEAVSGPCASTVAYICIAGKGYDGPTGWGSPNGTTGL